MKVPKEYYDEIFEFKDLWDVPSKCGLKIRKHDGKVYVIATELYQENTGTSITYTGETLLDQICKAKQLDPENVIYSACPAGTTGGTRRLAHLLLLRYVLVLGC